MRSLGFDFGSVYTKAVLLDGSGRVLASQYAKNGAGEAAALEQFLDQVEQDHPGHSFRVGLAALGARSAAQGTVTTVNPILAIAAGLRRLHPDAQSIIEIGGHTSKFVVLDEGSVRDFATNEACAAGTGSFLEQQARRLTLSIEELSQMSVDARGAATIAGRCSVFAKSDMIHLQQKGTPVEEIAYGLCAAICRNALTTLLKGRDAPTPLVLAGGCARNAGVVRAFREIVTGRLEVSAQPGLEAAIGAATVAAVSERAPLALPEVRQWLRSVIAERAVRRSDLPPLPPPRDSRRREEPQQTHHHAVEAWLGVDVGSVSTDLVLLDDDGTVISSVYLPTRGRPVDVLLDGIDQLHSRFPAGLRISGCGVTGSGRYLAARLLNADAVRNEITCQILGARHFIPDADTILEIGGQDSKFMSLRDGALADFAMNKICAAGTGSFLEEQAREIGIQIERDFASRAFAANNAIDLGTRCTVFIETEVVSALRNGAQSEEICAGLARAIVRNYLDKVVGSRRLGRSIVFQGGVASNDAVVAAFEQALGRPVQVHPFNRISGAIGAAIAAVEAVKGKRVTQFRAVPRSVKPSFRSFECRHCSNRCEVNVLNVAGERAFFGDTCERYTERARGESPSDLPPNLAEEFVARCEAAFERRGSGGLTIGIPRASTLFDALPFWATFFRSLGHNPVLSGPSNDQTLTLGLKHLSVGVCLPIKLTAGHVQSLLQHGVDLVFVPSIVLLPGDDPSRSYSCPYAMAVPFIVSGRDARLFSPVVSMENAKEFADGFEPYLDLLRTTRAKVEAGWEAARRAEEKVEREFRRRAGELLSDRNASRAVAVLGKPYNTFDGYLNLSLFERLRRLGVLAIPQKFLPWQRERESQLPWRFSAEMAASAASLASVDGIHAIVVSNFGCGPDAFTFREIEENLGGRPHLVLEFDEHRGEAGLITRIEAFLDQLDSGGERRPAEVLSEETGSNIPAPGSVVRLPYFADHAYAFSGLLRLNGCDARVLPPPGAHIRALGERHSLGKECHAYSMLAGDLLDLSRRCQGDEVSFFFPGTALPCLLHEYGSGMRRLLRELGITNVRVSAPTGIELAEAFTLDALERFYRGLLSIELLVKGVCQIRPYELEKGLTDAVHRENLIRMEDAIAGGDILAALDRSLESLSKIRVRRDERRPVVGIVGDIYTKSNFVANDDLVRWLEDHGMEVWPSPFQIDMVDFGISRALSLSLQRLDGAALLRSGAIAANRAFQQWRVRRVVGNRVARQDEPDYAEMKRLTAPYMPNESHQLLFINIAKTVDFAQNGADGIINAICFNCMVGNASAAIVEKIRRDYDDIPIITAVYAGCDDPSRQMILEAYVAEVTERAKRKHASKDALNLAAV